MDASSIAQRDNDLPEDIKEGIIVVTRSPTPQSGYIITSLPSTNSGISRQETLHLFSPLLKTYFLSQLPSHLSLPPEDLHVVISTKSGTEQAASTFENVLKPVLNTVGRDVTSYRVLETDSSDTIKNFVDGHLRKRACDGVNQTVLLLSGDGGVVDVVNGLLQDGDTKSRYVLVIPCYIEVGFVDQV